MGTANTGIFCCGECFWQSWPIVDSPKHGLWWYTPNFSMFKIHFSYLNTYGSWLTSILPKFPRSNRRFVLFKPIFFLVSSTFYFFRAKIPIFSDHGQESSTSTSSRKRITPPLSCFVGRFGSENFQGTGPSVFSCHFPIQLVYLPPGWWLICG